MRQINVLIADSSLLVRESLQRELSRDINVKIAAKTTNLYETRDQIKDICPDVVICDLHLDERGGASVIKKMFAQYQGIVIITSSRPISETDAGVIHAAGFIVKPATTGISELERFSKNVLACMKMVLYNDALMPPLGVCNSTVIVIGASTGGAEAVENVITALPALMPPIVVVQHMPEKITASFARRLNQLVHLSVKEAQDGDVLIPGQVYIAPGGFHTMIRRQKKKFFIICEKEETGEKPCPCIDKLYESVVNTVSAEHSIGVILTGMGNDGTRGLKKMHDNGSITIGQDKDSSVVYGMPKVAYDIGAVKHQLPISKIADKLISSLIK